MKLTANHRLADRAVLEVCRVLNDCGAMAERIRNDYGEDLVVQSQLNDEAHNFRILIKVKGTLLKENSDGFYRVMVSIEHLWRWITNSDPVILCIYDDVPANIYAIAPSNYFTQWDLATSPAKSRTIRFKKTDI